MTEFEQISECRTRLRANGLSAENADKVLLKAQETISEKGGTADDISKVLDRLLQALRINKVGMRDFKRIAKHIERGNHG